MNKLWEKIKHLVANRAIHRRGFVLGAVKREQILEHLKLEIKELEESPDSVDEVADCLCCLLQYAHHIRWTMTLDRLEEVALRKLEARFHVPSRFKHYPFVLRRRHEDGPQSDIYAFIKDAMSIAVSLRSVVYCEFEGTEFYVIDEDTEAQAHAKFQAAYRERVNKGTM